MSQEEKTQEAPAQKVRIDPKNPLLAALKEADAALARAKIAYANETVKAYNALVLPAQSSMNTLLQELAKSAKVDFAKQKWRLDLAEGVFVLLE